MFPQLPQDNPSLFVPLHSRVSIRIVPLPYPRKKRKETSTFHSLSRQINNTHAIDQFIDRPCEDRGQQDRSLPQQSLQKRFHVYPRGYRRIGRQEPLQAGKHAPRKSRWRLARSLSCNVPADERVQLARGRVGFPRQDFPRFDVRERTKLENEVR